MASEFQTEIPSKYEVLRDLVKDYPGILSAAEALFRELNSPSPKRPLLVKEMRTYALKNFYLHDHSGNGAEAVRIIIDTFLEAIDNPDASVRQSSVESLIFYLEKVLVDSDNAFQKYATILQDCFARLAQLKEKEFALIVTNAHQLKKLGQIMIDKMPEGFDAGPFNDLLLRYFSETFAYWLSEKDPSDWLRPEPIETFSEVQMKKLRDLFYPISHDHLKELLYELDRLRETEDQYARLQELVKLPGYIQVARYYEDLCGMLAVTGDPHKDLRVKMLYLLSIMEVPGLSGIHENILREINRTISNMAKIEEPEQIKAGFSEIFSVLKNAFRTYPETALYCVQSIGNEIYRKGSSGLVEWFSQKIISLGFQYPDIQGVSEEWQVRSNRAHLKNIRVWLELIENNPKWSKSLISALIINLRLCGVHISDTDIFQKDITKLLNSDIRPTYHLVKLMAKVFPVYFSDIGAEGPLRDVSTQLDECTHRSDTLVHCLRKQSHVDSSARVVDFIEEVIRFWQTKDKTPLKRFLPDEVYEQITESGEYIDELHTIFDGIFCRNDISGVTDLLRLKEEVLQFTQGLPNLSGRERKRACLAVEFYQLLNKKYNIDPLNIKDQLQYAQSLGLPGADSLITVLRDGNIAERLDGVLNYLALLQNIILSPEQFEPMENIYRKRHIAAGIPSMYGKYQERKFDALALTFRLESLANILFEELINSMNLTFITRATLFKIQKFANLFFKALKLDGISSNKMENALELLSVALDVRRFSFSQYIDIFRGFSEAVQDILNTYYSDVFKNNLKQIVPQLGVEQILPQYHNTEEWQNESEFINTISEQFLRETVASSFGLQQLDNFISRILKTLFEQAEGLDVQNLDLLMSYDPKKALSGVHVPNAATRDRIHLGNKGHNLIKLASLGIPVPPGFIITTEVFRCEEAINKFKHVREHLDEGIGEQLAALEKHTGKIFGDPENPLLVSVRSGGAISMPGMMISFLNVGINETIVEGLIRKTSKPWFAWDCYRRFLQGWGMSFGIERDKFDEIMNLFKVRHDVLKKIQFTSHQMRDLALAYRETIRSHGIEITDDPKIQLQITIDQVFNSWHSKKAQAYREILGISENWGTAVIVQSMAYGNLDTSSGTGVLFTRNPQDLGDRVMLWGDFANGAQGEDIVSGLVKTLPISNEQKPFEDRTSQLSFEESFPEVYGRLLSISRDLIYIERWGAQEIEFTFEGKDAENLYILQTRDMALRRKESFMAFVPSERLTASYLSRGIGVGGGALSGRAVFDLDEIHELREKDPHTPLILIRSDTVPDDIRHISAADGLLTARGGSTSHASIIANRLGKTCVVGCNNLVVWENEKKCSINEGLIKVGDFLSIDGRNGSVYTGRHTAKEIKAEVVTKL